MVIGFRRPIFAMFLTASLYVFKYVDTSWISSKSENSSDLILVLYSKEGTMTPDKPLRWSDSITSISPFCICFIFSIKDLPGAVNDSDSDVVKLRLLLE